MKLLITAAMLMTVSGAFANELDYVDLSFQDHEQYPANQPAVGSASVDYVHASFQFNDEYVSVQTGSQPEIGGPEVDYLNESFHVSY